MTEFEKQLVAEMDKDYLLSVRDYSGALALHTTNLFLHYGVEEKQTYNDIIRLIAVSAQILRVAPGKFIAKTGMPGEKVVELEPNSDIICVNAEYVTGKDDLESARKLLIGIHAAIFLRYVNAVTESENAVVREYAEKTGWNREWKHPVDRKENPRIFFRQSYIKAALAYGIAVTEESLEKAGNAMRIMSENNK